MAFGGIAGRRNLRCAVSFAALLILVTGCVERDVDHVQSRRDFNELMERKPPEVAARLEPPPIPSLQPIIAAPPPPGAAQRLVSVSVTDPDIPVRDVLLELARKAGVDIDLDPSVSGGVILTARERPFEEVIARICDQDGLRYSLKDNILKVGPDNMHYQIYHLDVLNTVRTMQTDLANSLSIATLIQGGGSGGGINSSTSDIKSNSTLDSWKDIEDNVKTILANSAPPTVQAAAVAPAPTPPPPAPAPAPAPVVVVMPSQSGAPGVPGTVAPPPTAVSTDTSSPPPAPTPAPDNGTTPHFSTSHQAGILSVYGTEKQQRLIQAYLDKVLSKIGTQVLIEAKIVEIALTNQYNTGVDWQSLRQNLQGTGFGFSTLAPSTNTATSLPSLPVPYGISQPFGTFGLNAGFTTFGGDLAAMINLVKSYGDVRTLSSPRLTVMNNQPATLKVAQNHVYFKMTATVTSTPATVGSPASQTATYNSQLQTLPIGLVMLVQPSIDVEHGLITLNLRPSVTAWPGNTVSDPAVALSIASACGGSITGACSPASVANAVTAASVPIVDVREMESMVTVPSGAVVVLGGLMQEVVSKNDSGVPGLADVPIAGNLFKATSDQIQLTELVVFLKATVVHGPDTVDWADKDTYKKFHDARPLAF